MSKKQKIKRLKAELAASEARASRYLCGLHKIEELDPSGTPEALRLILDEALGNMRHANRVLREVYEPAIRASMLATNWIFERTD